jgi:hypothetical protein
LPETLIPITEGFQNVDTVTGKEMLPTALSNLAIFVKKGY